MPGGRMVTRPYYLSPCTFASAEPSCEVRFGMNFA